VFNVVEDFHILNHIILLAKYYIYKRKLNIIHPSLKVFIAKVKATCQIEQKIAVSGNKLAKHYKNGTNFYLASAKLVIFCDGVYRDIFIM